MRWSRRVISKGRKQFFCQRRAKGWNKINRAPRGRLERIQVENFTLSLAVLTTGIVFTGPKRVSEVARMPCEPSRKRRLIQEERRPRRQPPPPGFLHSLWDAFLRTLLKGEQRALSGATKPRGNLCPVCPRMKQNKTPAVENKFFLLRKI